MTKREVFWPAFLIFAALSWCLIFSFEVEPFLGQRWLQVLAGLGVWASIALRIWRGRYEA